FAQCEADCSSEGRCLGFGYNYNLLRCFKSDINNPEDISSCDQCYFSTKNCLGDVLGLITTSNVEQVSKTDTTYSVRSGTMPMSTVSTGNSETTTLSTFESSNSETASLYVIDSSTLYSPEHETSISDFGNETCKQICFCPSNFTKNHSIEIWKEEMMAKLKVIKDELSVNKRKLICASDPRYSSRVVGLVGIAVLSIIGAIIVIPDLISAALHHKRAG
ncbi:uncharacterized protein LOC133172448, partial [Saccostrea echinata]|uniref:uncharacterized protein LOC133172448 n=1 Tax=Saccostrea echinata TaxID=191078 RepID=UPI002A7FEECF